MPYKLENRILSLKSAYPYLNPYFRRSRFGSLGNLIMRRQNPLQSACQTIFGTNIACGNRHQNRLREIVACLRQKTAQKAACPKMSQVREKVAPAKMS